jgi:large subunit ribosomal protein L9
MNVILRSKVDGLGQRGDIVEVAEGYARNFLFPKGHAIKASPGALDQAAKMRSSRDQKDQTAREAATAIATTLVPKTITVSAKASGEGKLFGSIHATEIVEAVKEQTGIEIDRKAIAADHNIKTVGQHTVTASLHSDVSFPITLDVVAAD